MQTNASCCPSCCNCPGSSLPARTPSKGCQPASSRSAVAWPCFHDVNAVAAARGNGAKHKPDCGSTFALQLVGSTRRGRRARQQQALGPARAPLLATESEEHAAAEAHAGPSQQKPRAKRGFPLPARKAARTGPSPASQAAEETPQPGRPCLLAHIHCQPYKCGATVSMSICCCNFQLVLPPQWTRHAALPDDIGFRCPSFHGMYLQPDASYVRGFAHQQTLCAGCLSVNESLAVVAFQTQTVQS